MKTYIVIFKTEEKCMATVIHCDSNKTTKELQELINNKINNEYTKTYTILTISEVKE